MTGVVFLMDLFHIQRRITMRAIRSIYNMPYGRLVLAIIGLELITLLLDPELVVFQLILLLIVYLIMPSKSAKRRKSDQRSANKEETPTGGEIVDLGQAPYQHQPGNRVSYFITLRQRDQEHTLWGVDLARVVDEHELTSGDCVTLTCQGRQPVKVKDRNGRFKQVHRNTWTATVHSRCYQDPAAHAA
ncbi:hypothetical protein [Halomonas caseinilytica]|uniref:hypothetical protein n=1 Tax=Halomonas caseinilytica TaxID=438744 RepID=UPI0011AFD9E9|nr:hypothetical protein [Halomonas caseinilytica]